MAFSSAVVLPEVFLKAVSVARNLNYDLNGMTTVDLDMIDAAIEAAVYQEINRDKAAPAKLNTGFIQQ